jgi:hypothetical protein
MMDEWFQAFTHESGHAVMAAIQSVSCHGVFLRKSPLKATALVPPLPQSQEQTTGHRLFLAAGSAAETIILGTVYLPGSKEDRRIFGNPQGTTFDGKVTEAQAILLSQKPRIERLASRLYGMYNNAGGDFSGFRSQLADLGDEGIKDHWVLLDEEELKEELEGVAKV